MRGLGNLQKRKAIFEYFRDRADIICFQETHSTADSHHEWTAQWGGKAYFSDGEKNARGVCILIKKELDVKVLKEVKDNEGRYLALHLLLENQNVTVFNIYAPNQDSPEFFVQIFQGIT